MKLEYVTAITIYSGVAILVGFSLSNTTSCMHPFELKEKLIFLPQYLDIGIGPPFVQWLYVYVHVCNQYSAVKFNFHELKL